MTLYCTDVPGTAVTGTAAVEHREDRYVQSTEVRFRFEQDLLREYSVYHIFASFVINKWKQGHTRSLERR